MKGYKTMENILPKYTFDYFDKKSIEFKKKNFYLSFLYIFLLFLGALFADIGNYFINDKTSITLAVLSTLSSLLIYNFKKNKNFIELWTRSRVLAETIKSEWFMFVVGGGDYPIKSNNEEVYNINKFLSKIEVLVDEYKSNIHEFEKKYSEISDFELDQDAIQMRTTSIENRSIFYMTERINDQQKWYDLKSKSMKKNLNISNIFFQIVLIVGFSIGILMWLNFSEIVNIRLIDESDFFSIAVAFAFAIDSFRNIEQYERLSLSYEKTWNELSDAATSLKNPNNEILTNELVFNEFIEDIETKISSEHKSWSITTITKDLHNE